jgi:diguanylate cyclase (GGDEF)-like protein
LNRIGTLVPLPGLDSLRGRYVYVAALFCIFMLGAASIGQIYMQRSTAEHVLESEQRAETAEAVRSLMIHVRDLEIALQRFVLVPDKEQEAAIWQAYSLLQPNITRLLSSSWIRESSELSELVAQIQDRQRELQPQLKAVIDVRMDVRKWFPAMSVMLERLLPLNVEFATEVSMAVREAQELSADPAQRKNYELFTDLRHAWIQMASEFRLYVANRFGIFASDPEPAMRARARNITLYADTVRQLLARLQARNEKDLIAFQGSDSLSRLGRLNERWQAGYLDVRRILQSPAWRRDLPMLENHIDPISHSIRQALHSLQQTMESASANDVTSLSSTASQLSAFLWFAAFVGITVTIGGFFLFRRLVVSPISDIARALKAEAQGVGGAAVRETGMQEIHDLTSAFNDMHQQVHTRQQRLEYMAEHDGLTGLFNRSYFQTELERVTKRVRNGRARPCALLYIDLDNFKYVNDTMGHIAGDRLLVEVADGLMKRARRGELVARFGGDEFVVLLYDTADAAAAAAESFRRKLVNLVFVHDGERVDIACSIGVAQIGPQTRSADDVLGQADVACHSAKRNGRNQIYVFGHQDQDKVSGMSLDIGWSRRIKHALEGGHFTLVGQPIASTRTGTVKCHEVLLRMLDEQGAFILPAGFLPSAERFGLAVEIDRWVVVKAIETLATQRRTENDVCYSVNLSSQSLSDPAMAKLIIDTLERCAVPPRALTLEVTETAAIADMTVARRFLGELREAGCLTALDDFGSGFTSFPYLKELPIDLVKIDGRYIRQLASNPVDQAMIRALNDVVHAVGMQTIAEFVEDDTTLAMLGEFGVDFAQGFYIGKPATLGSQVEVARSVGCVS